MAWTFTCQHELIRDSFLPDPQCNNSKNMESSTLQQDILKFVPFNYKQNHERK